jgi:hypothetical protein
VCDHRKTERGPIFQVGNDRKINECREAIYNLMIPYMSVTIVDSLYQGFSTGVPRDVARGYARDVIEKKKS